MTRRFLGFASLLLTLFSSGCTSARLARVEGSAPSSPPNPIQPAYAAMKPHGAPDVLPPTTDVPPKTPTADASAKWKNLTDPPPPPQGQIAPLPIAQAQSAVDSRPFIDVTPKHPIVRALECMLDNRLEEAQHELRVYDAGTQEFLLRMLPPLSIVAKNTKLSAADSAALSEQMKSINRYLQQNAAFTLPKMCFCELDSIKGYAIYKPLPPDPEFVAGQYVQIYFELKNFASKQSGGDFETKFAGRIEIRDDKGKVVYPYSFPKDQLKLVSRERLGEYYHKFGVPLPSYLQPGFYTLVVEMTDETLADAPPRTARGSLPLRIAAPKD